MCYVDKIDIFLQTQMLRALALELRKLHKKNKTILQLQTTKTKYYLGLYM